MDSGVIFEKGFTVEPCEGGSFVLHAKHVDPGFKGKRWAFSNVADLMVWLAGQSALAFAGPDAGSSGLVPDWQREMASRVELAAALVAENSNGSA